MNKKVVIFFHLTRTGGITLNSILLRHFGPGASLRLKGTHFNGAEEVQKFRHLSQQTLESIQYLNGHMPFGLHTVFNRPFEYITLLRDPVDVIISDYYYTISRPQHEFYSSARAMTLKDFAASGLDLVNNYQTRMLSGYGMLAHTRSASLPADALDKAKANLTTYFSVVGTTELFNETLVLLKRHLGLRSIYYLRKNTNKHHPTRRDAPEDVLELIQKNNMLDSELHAFAGVLLNASIERYGAAFRRRVRSFTIANAAYGYAGSLLNGGKNLGLKVKRIVYNT